MRLTLAMGQQPTVVKLKGQEVLQAALALPSGEREQAAAVSVPKATACIAHRMGVIPRWIAACHAVAYWPALHPHHALLPALPTCTLTTMCCPALHPPTPRLVASSAPQTLGSGVGSTGATPPELRPAWRH